MRLSSTFLATVAVIALMAGTAQAANTAQGTANATVISAIAIAVQEGSVMQFGKLVPPSSGSGTAASATDAPTGGVVQSGTRSDQLFTVTGNAGDTYNTTGSDPSVTLSDGGANTLVAALTYTSANSFTLTGGTDTLTAHGVVTVPSTAVAGNYTGNYNVTVNYN